MDIKKARKLLPVDEVYWEDPDEGKRSRYLTIRNIEIVGEVIQITDMDGGYLECFAHELK
jgi:hypothetical protein